MPAIVLAEPKLYDNLGTLHHPISTSSDVAQRYFDQGLRFVYAFNHEEAIRSFEEATRQDPSAPMPYWGIALALGPNINAATYAIGPPCSSQLSEVRADGRLRRVEL